METKFLSEIVNKFQNYQSNNLNSNNVTSNLSNNNIKNQVDVSVQYPYGEFPYKYSKNGVEILKNNTNAQSQNAEHVSNTNSINTTTLSTQSNTVSTTPNLDNSNINTLLPLLMNMKTNKKMDTFDMFNLLIPLLSNNNPNIKEILKYIKPQNTPIKTQQVELPKSKMPPIDSFEKV